MKIELRIVPEKWKNFDVKSEFLIEDLINELKLNKETVIVKKNNEITPETDLISEGDKIEIITIVSGG